MRLQHSVAEESIGPVRHLIEQAAGVASAAVRVGGGKSGYELRDEVDVGFERVNKHECMDLEEGGCAVAFQLEEREALSLSCAPKPGRMQSWFNHSSINRRTAAVVG